MIESLGNIGDFIDRLKSQPKAAISQT